MCDTHDQTAHGQDKLVQLYKMAEASVTGKPPKMGEHVHIRPH